MAKRNFSDLAIAGGPPAFEETLHVGRPNLPDRETFHRLVDDIFDRRWLSNRGPLLVQFEKELATHLNVSHVVAVCNATVAIEVLLRVMGRRGEVLVPGFTFVATAHAVEWMGLKPVFVDIDPETHLMDLADAESKISDQTVAVMPVHLWGEPCRPPEYELLAKRHRLGLFFDAAHAFSCEHQGLRLGRFGDAEVFSFHATKTFNTFEGGAIATNDANLARELRLAINFGFSGVDQVSAVGTNGKLNEISAAMGLCQLANLDDTLEINRRHQINYSTLLAPINGIVFRTDRLDERRNFQYCVAEVDYARDALLRALHAENILARRYFFPGLHRVEPYVSQRPPVSLPHTEAVADRVLILPTGTAISDADVETVAEIIRLALSDVERLTALCG